MKKIFIIAPHFPPSALPPSQRVRLIVKNLQTLNFESYIFTTFSTFREEDDDPWMTELVGTNFTLFEVKALNQNITRKIGIGDLGLRLIPYLYKKVLKEAKIIKPDFILYPVPPWYILLIAPRIKKLTGIPYGIDFIDPWVVGKIPENANLKKKISQKIARKFERNAVENADVIYSVSEGINSDLVMRYKTITNKPIFAIPYGVEISDYDFKIDNCTKNEIVTFRYIGAVWADAYPVLEPLFHALSQIQKKILLKIEFYGTSYTGKNLAKRQTIKWIEKYKMQNFMFEEPLRVSYRKAIELTISADIILIFGGMQPYYAASKLMGLIASGKPFFAFLHKDSFPAKFLKQLNYKYIVEYSQNELPATKIEEIKIVIQKLILEKDNFEKFDMNNPLIKEQTALGMTEKFINPIIKLLKND